MNNADPLELAIVAILVVFTFWVIFWLGFGGLDVSDEEQEKLKEQADKATAERAEATKKLKEQADKATDERAEATKKQRARLREMASSSFKWVSSKFNWVSSNTGNLTVKDFVFGGLIIALLIWNVSLQSQVSDHWHYEYADDDHNHYEYADDDHNHYEYADEGHDHIELHYHY